MAYDVPRNTVQGQPHRYTSNPAGGSYQQGLHNLRATSGSHPPRDVLVQPFHAMTNQNVQGNSIPQDRNVRTPYNQLNSHGIRLRPVSDLRMPPFRCQEKCSHVCPQPILIAVYLRLASSMPSNPLALIA